MIAQWTPKLARSRARRRIKALRSKVADVTHAIAYEFGDEDQYVCDLCDRLAANVDQDIEELEEAIADFVRRSEEAGR